ncbi:MAG: BamA/TamA family outer membrane protein [Myxococcota bacterium]|nr:BamA/TamA family outer membrane protein [Myxococcota bacterium]
MTRLLRFFWMLCIASAWPLIGWSSPPAPGKTGWDFAGFPLVNFTTDRGVGYGAFLAVYDYGDVPDPTIPFKTSIGGQFYQTTGGYAFHKLLLDFPKFLGSDLRLDVVSGYETWDSAWYFGIGNRIPRLPEDETPENFYEYDTTSLWAVPTIRIPLDSQWSVFSGYTFRHARVNAYDESRLAFDRPTGLRGGVLSQLSIGLMWDTRNAEPTPTRGFWSEVSVRTGLHAFGSDFQLWGANTTHRYWLPLVESGRLVLATRLGFDVQLGALPFFHQHIMGGSQWVEIGGNSMLRGLPVGRYRGNATLYGTAELRWDVFRFNIKTARFSTLLVPFTEVGRVWAQHEDDDALHLHGTTGAGVRLIYNEVFVMRFDAALGFEEYRVPADGTAALASDNTDTRPIFGIYAIVNHPF